MDSHRFDAFTKWVAQTRLSRRTALRQLGWGGMAAGLFGAMAAPMRASAQATPAATPTAGAAGELAANNATLFVQTAASGTFGPNPAATGTPPAATGTDTSATAATPTAAQPAAYRLTLHGHTGETIGFSDRPARNFGEVPTPRFLKSLGFTPADPPNAALVVDTAQAQDAVFLLELMTPAYDPGTQTLTYDANLLQQYPNARGSALTPLAGKAQSTTPAASFESASLFIDDCPDATLYCFDPYDSTKLVGTIPIGYCWDWHKWCCNPCAGIDAQALCGNAFGAACSYGSPATYCQYSLTSPALAC